MCNTCWASYPQQTIIAAPAAKTLTNSCITTMTQASIQSANLTKLDVALHLLQRAGRALLEENDGISALVLAGSAEDVLQGLLKRAGRGQEAARATLANWAPDFADMLAPEQAGMVTRAGAIDAMRNPFNWLRHADDENDPPEIAADLRFDASCALLRATQNFHALRGELPLSEADTVRLLHILGETT
jgi:hypothetical protein